MANWLDTEDHQTGKLVAEVSSTERQAQVDERQALLRARFGGIPAELLPFDPETFTFTYTAGQLLN